MESPTIIPNRATVTVTRNASREVIALRLVLADGTIVHDWVRTPPDPAYVIEGAEATIHNEHTLTQTLLNRTGRDIPFYMGWAEPLR